MPLSVYAKKIFANSLSYLSILDKKLIALQLEDQVVLMYHRIINPKHSDLVVQSGMYVTPDTFELHLQFLHEYFNIVPLSMMFSDFSDHKQRGKQRCVLTFDDGWVDFYQHAFPLLKKYNTSATVFLPTDYIGSDKWFWTDRFAWLLKEIDKINKTRNSFMSGSFPGLKHVLDKQGSFEDRLETGIDVLKKKKMADIVITLHDIEQFYNIKEKAGERVFVSWDEVREMKDSGYVTFGSHTASHPILTTIDENDIMNELELSKKKLIDEGAVDVSFIPFCYPNGNHDLGILKMVELSGYSLAVTTKNGRVAPNCNRFALNRVGIHQDMTSSKAMLGCRILGII